MRRMCIANCIRTHNRCYRERSISVSLPPRPRVCRTPKNSALRRGENLDKDGERAERIARTRENTRQRRRRQRQLSATTSISATAIALPHQIIASTARGRQQQRRQSWRMATVLVYERLPGVPGASQRERRAAARW